MMTRIPEDAGGPAFVKVRCTICNGRGTFNAETSAAEALQLRQVVALERLGDLVRELVDSQAPIIDALTAAVLGSIVSDPRPSQLPVTRSRMVAALNEAVASLVDAYAEDVKGPPS